ncbi:MAG TPA: T9SS type A sorting domain-containing protein [Bacteroidia bacterium]|nr:T9SS type A sorting domain-containing protein [Bacteroidia bacterium]
MKKIYSLLLFSLISVFASAQCSPTTTLNAPGYAPEELDTADVGVAYNMVINLRIPADTIVVLGGQSINADIDSIVLGDVLGMPSGFTYGCGVPNCAFTPDTTHCAVLMGNPTAQQIGTYPIRLAVVAYAHGVVFGTPTNFPPQPDTIDRFTLVVGSGIGVFVENTPGKPTVQLYPNPAKEAVSILLSGKTGETITYSLSDITGKEVFASATTLTSGNELVTLPLNGFAKGIYLVKTSGNNGTAATRLVVQ